MVEPIKDAIPDILSHSVKLIGGLVLCFMTSWRMCVLAITTIGPALHFQQLVEDWRFALRDMVYASLGASNLVASQAIRNIRTVRAFGAEPGELAKFKVASRDSVLWAIKDALGMFVQHMVAALIGITTTAVLLGYGGYLAIVLSGVSGGTVVTFQMDWNIIQKAFSTLQCRYERIARGSGSAHRVLSLINSKPDIQPNQGVKLERSDIIGTLKLENVTFAYQMRPEHKVLDNFSLSIVANKVTALVGYSGGGKSTLIHLLLRFYDPQYGRITLDGRDIREIDLGSLHRNTAVVAQDTELFATTIKDNITYGSEPGQYSDDQIIEASRAANAHEFIATFPDGYLTRVGEKGLRLSGGQRQRIAIARAMLRKAPLLFLDEATSALDAESEGKVQEGIDRLIASTKCTVVLVAHRLSTVVSAHKIAVIHKGKVVESGRHEELVALNGEYARLVARQLKRDANTLSLEPTAQSQADPPQSHSTKS